MQLVPTLQFVQTCIMLDASLSMQEYAPEVIVISNFLSPHKQVLGQFLIHYVITIWNFLPIQFLTSIIYTVLNVRYMILILAISEKNVIV